MRGVGGTRNCDWWFTDQAVLIDTAGRYTTQDSDARVDGAAWLGFLRLLKQHRRRQPLNGVLVAISLSDLAALDDDARHAHARAIRRRVRELHDELGVRMPIYAVFTKADLIAGFVEFFDNLGKEEREQVWGMTFPLDDGKPTKRVRSRTSAPSSTGCSTRLNDRMLERVHQEPDVERRRLIYGFPAADGVAARASRGSSWTRSSARAGWRRVRCCAASISPAARRTARRSTACWARWPAGSACRARR